MAGRTKTRREVTAEQVPQVTALFNAEDPPPASVVATPDGKGTFTVVATWPASPSGTKASAGND